MIDTRTIAICASILIGATMIAGAMMVRGTEFDTCYRTMVAATTPPNAGAEMKRRVVQLAALNCAKAS